MLNMLISMLVVNVKNTHDRMNILEYRVKAQLLTELALVRFMGKDKGEWKYLHSFAYENEWQI